MRLPPAGTGSSVIVNVTPMIDVVMVLIVFFLIVGKLAADLRADVDLPATAVGQIAQEREPLVVNVLPAQTPEGVDFPGVRVAIGSREVYTAAELADEFHSRHEAGRPPPIRVRASRRLNYGSVDPVLRALARAGADQVRLVTERH